MRVLISREAPRPRDLGEIASPPFHPLGQCGEEAADRVEETTLEPVRMYVRIFAVQMILVLPAR